MIQSVDTNFEREPLLRPFGFKGSSVTEIWQVVNLLQSASGQRKVGLSNQSVLWSDASVYAAHTETGGNTLMYALTEHALQLLKGRSYTDPIDLQNQIFDEVYAFGKKITQNPDLKKTFVLNALVGIDNALWLIYAAENGITNFDDMIPAPYRAAFSHHHDKVASIPLVTYSDTLNDIIEIADSGYFFLKIKIGQPGSQEEMLGKDMERISVIHKAIGHYHTSGTATGKLSYYLDANGRYEKKETLLRFIDHLKKTGVFNQVAIIEEPFDEHADITVDDIPLRVAADESAHSDADLLTRIQMGYKAVALKTIAKTLSMTLKKAKLAKERHIPCFCADLTVNPVLVDWNKNIAARLDPLPGLNMGLLESNGAQNYKNWKLMESYHPYSNAEWRKVKNGVYNLNKDFYDTSGGVFATSQHYQNLFKL